MGTSFGARISGIVWVDKRYLRLVNGCLDYHRPIITSACPLKRSHTSLRPKLVPISPRFWSWEFKKLIHLIIQDSSIYWFAGFENNATTGMTARIDLKTELTNRRPAKEQRTCLIPHERALRPFFSNVLLGFSRFCVFQTKVGKSICYRFVASNYKHISSFISDVMLLICTKWSQVNFNLHLQDHISVIQKIIMGSWQFLR